MITRSEDNEQTSSHEVNLNFLLDFIDQFIPLVWNRLTWWSKRRLRKDLEISALLTGISITRNGLGPRDLIIQELKRRSSQSDTQIRQDYAVVPYLMSLTRFLNKIFIRTSKNVELGELYEVFQGCYENVNKEYLDTNPKPDIINFLPSPIVSVLRVKVAELVAKEAVIAEIKKSEELRQTTVSKEYVENIIASMMNMLIVLNEKGMIMEINKSVTDQLGYKEKELIGKAMSTITNDESFPIGGLGIEELIKSGTLTNHEQEYRAKDGNMIPVSCTSSVMKNKVGEIMGIVCVAQDISERKKAEETTNQLLNKLETVNKELNEMIYIISHDLKAPLRGISMLADWLYEENKEKFDETNVANLNLLLRRVRRMYGFLEGILMYSKIGNDGIEKSEVNLNILLSKVVESLDTSKSGTKIIVAETMPTIRANEIHLHQLFQNLISNAINYMDKSDGVITIGVTDDKDNWGFYVKDNGPGIDKKHFERIFKIFQTLNIRDKVESTGIGLTIVKKIVDQYDGKVWVESEVGKGTTFLFTLSK